MGLQNIIFFNDKLEKGQLSLAKILLTEGMGQDVKKRGRPKKGFEKNKKESPLKESDSNVGKRKIRIPKKFQETVHDINGDISENNKIDSEEKNADLEKYKLNIDEGE